MFSTFFLLEMCEFCIKPTYKNHPFPIPLSKVHLKMKCPLSEVYYYTAQSHLKGPGQGFAKHGLCATSMNINLGMCQKCEVTGPTLDQLNQIFREIRGGPALPGDPEAH